MSPNQQLSRRGVIKVGAAWAAVAAAGAVAPVGKLRAAADVKAPFKVSLAQWSLHRALGKGGKKTLDNLDFAKTAKGLGIEAVEYVNQFFMDKAKDAAYIEEMRKRAEGEGVRSLLIMCDGEGRLGDPDEKKRTQAVENHYKWVEAAKALGCHSIRVNAASAGSFEEQAKLAADGLRRLTEFGDKHGLNVIVENHGGLSSNGQWLAQVIKAVGHARCGTLPDFGNFRVSKTEEYDRYKGVQELMPFARGVSAKSHDFDEKGNEVHTDYPRMIKIVMDHAPEGWVATGKYIGVEFEGGKVDEITGIKLTKALLERVAAQLSA